MLHRRRSKMLADVGMLKTFSKSAHVNDLGFAWTGPSSLLHGPTAPPSLHGPALLLVSTVFPPGGFALPCRYTLHHPYICPCFWRKHFYIPLFLHFLWNANYTWASQLLRLPNNSGNKGAFSESWQGVQHHRHTHVSIVAQCGLCWVGSLG